ncbi:MAG: hypothetical protein M3Q50_02885 [Chloroflexota bacterium]|nr:hypothetical protein [Chloroflexia bacterium]MDQ3225566.1 hypothetical protein [Chloroflexota bacterium]
MPGQQQSLRIAHDLLLVVAVALGTIGLGVIAAGVLHLDESPRPDPSLAGHIITAILPTSGGTAWPATRSSPEPENQTAQNAPPPIANPELSRPRGDDPTEPLAPIEPAARRTYLLGSSAVAHRGVWVHEYVATPPASELTALAAGSWQP